MSQSKLILILVVVLGFLLRFLFLELFPAGVTADELQQGYTAYSILKTGKDEWGDTLPLNPRSFGEYKPPLYAYSIIPFNALFGLNVFSTRFPSVIAGMGVILLVFFITNAIFKNSKVALASAFFLAVSPWHIIFSRIGWESNIGLFLFCFGVLMFLLSKGKPIFLVYSSIFFGLTLLTYNSFKLFTPLFVVALVILYKDYFKLFDKKWIYISCSIFLFFILILAQGWIFSGSGKRASDTAVYNPENILPLRDVQVADKLPQPFNRIVNNKIVYLLTQVTQNYFGYFSTTFLISPHRGDGSVFNLPGRWLIPPWQFLFFAIAGFLLIKDSRSFKKILLIWLVLAPVPAALTRDYMQTLRVESLLILFPIFAAYGLWRFLDWLKSPKFKIITLAIISFMIFWTVISDTDYYLFHHFKRPVGGLKFGYQKAVEYTEQNKDKYDKIIFTKQESMPQIFVAFYSKMDPVFFQSYSKDWVRFEKQEMKFVDMIDMDLGKYKFKNIEWNKDREEKNALIISATESIPTQSLPIKEILGPDGKVIFRIFDTNRVKK